MLHMLQQFDVEFISKLLSSILTILHFITNKARHNNLSFISPFSLFSINILLMNGIIAYDMHHVWRLYQIFINYMWRLSVV